MAEKIKTMYVCSECGYESVKWYGKCPGCGEWNTMTEEIREAVRGKISAPARVRASAVPVPITEITTEDEERYHAGTSWRRSRNRKIDNTVADMR